MLLRLLGRGGEAPLRRGDDLLERGLTQAGALTGRPEPDLGAIAEELYGELTEAERATVPEVSLRMIDGDELRPVGRDELPDSQAVDAMLTVFGAAGLVTRSGAAYELATPGLLHAWPRLRDRVAGNREGLPVHRRLAEAAALWNEHGRRPADLLHGSALDRTLQWAATAHKDLTLAARPGRRRHGPHRGSDRVQGVGSAQAGGRPRAGRPGAGVQPGRAHAGRVTLRRARSRRSVGPRTRISTSGDRDGRERPRLPPRRTAARDRKPAPAHRSGEGRHPASRAGHRAARRRLRLQPGRPAGGLLRARSAHPVGRRYQEPDRRVPHGAGQRGHQAGLVA
ncbi:hypothetical protein ACIBQ1_07785 [Nonomuraea sp. NPDC050153]|uniref:nSTAND1 domain-containing NTPase n=1 Tax=Nonomuraea sp. NPDC050153 TaxID=3364359 RepID=UPI003798CFDB